MADLAASSSSTSSTSSLFEIRYVYPDSSPYVARTALRHAARQLTERGLASAAQWTLEMLLHVPKPDYDDIKSPRSAAAAFTTPAARKRRMAPPAYPVQSTPAVGPGDGSGRFASMLVPSDWASNSNGSGVLQPAAISTTSNSSTSAHVRFAAEELSVGGGDGGEKEGETENIEEAEDEEDVFRLALSLYEHKQWERCAALLERHRVRGPKALFLQLYARYLIIEKRARQDDPDIDASKRGTKAKRSHRAELVPLLGQLINPTDSFLLHLKGILFRKLGKRIEAIDCLVRSLESFAYNWAAWQELCTCLEGGPAELQDIAGMLPNSFMTSFFCELFARNAAARITSDESLRRIDALLTIFPDAPYLLVCRGQTLHLMHELEASEAAYEAARAVDPLRLEGMADYSNSLFVQNKEEKLAHLTHMLAESGREDVEVCCAVGNYHTLRGDNHRAVEVFKRGVQLDPSCASAWILLGHGYIELKDSMAAAEMYRKALELNPRDVRAWTGLGNTYELNSAWAQALHYHKKAAASSPYDFRFWVSMANCYEKLNQPMQAIECYKRILALEQSVDAQLAIMDNIARLYEGLAGGGEDEDGEDGEDVDEDEYADRTGNGGEESAATHARDLLRACTWHRRIVELIDQARDTEDSADHARHVQEHVGSFLIAARWEMGMVPLHGARVGEEAAMQLDDNNTMEGQRTRNIALAHEYLQRVIMTGTEAVLEAEELLKRLALLRT